MAAQDFDRFAQLHVIASVQPYHAIDDGRWAERRIGHDRASRAVVDFVAELSNTVDFNSGKSNILRFNV